MHRYGSAHPHTHVYLPGLCFTSVFWSWHGECHAGPSLRGFINMPSVCVCLCVHVLEQFVSCECVCAHRIDLNQLIKPEGSGDASTSPQWKKVLFLPLCVFEALMPVSTFFFFFLTPGLQCSNWNQCFHPFLGLSCHSAQEQLPALTAASQARRAIKARQM